MARGEVHGWEAVADELLAATSVMYSDSKRRQLNILPADDL